MAFSTATERYRITSMRASALLIVAALAGATTVAVAAPPTRAVCGADRCWTETRRADRPRVLSTQTAPGEDIGAEATPDGTLILYVRDYCVNCRFSGAYVF